MKPNPVADLRLTARLTLPCGHVLERAACVPDHRPTWIQECAEVLAWWMASRTEGHDCAQVSEQNPSGYARPSQPPTDFGVLSP